MSTKIYDAFQWLGTQQQLQDFLTKLRGQYIEWSVGHLHKLRINTEEIKSSWELQNFLKDTIKRGLRDPYNLQASVVVYFYHEMILVQFFGIDSIYKDGYGSLSLQKHIEKSKMLRDFHYQNQTDAWYEDGREKLTKQQYREAAKDYRFREKVWKTLLKTYHTPGEAGLSYDLNADFTMFSIADKFFDILRKKENDGKEQKQDA